MSLVEDTLGLSSSSSNTHGTSALLSQKLDQAQEALQNFIQTRAPNSIRQSSLLGFLSNPNAPKVFVWTVVKLIQILSVIYLYYLIAPFPYTPVESSEPTQEPVQSLTLSIVGFYVLLGAAVGWLLLNQLAKPSLGGIPTKRDQEVSSQAPGGLLMRLLLHSAWTAVGFYIWLMALQILAPTRVAILEYIEYFVAIVMGGLLKWKNSRPVQFENAGLLLGALFLFSLSITSEQANFTRYELIFQINTIRFDGILSHAWGIVLLLAAIVCNLLRKNHARRLSADLGSVRLLGVQLGGRRLFWASLACGGALLLPMIFINFVISPGKIFFEFFSPRNVLLVIAGNCLITLPYYADRITKRQSKNSTSPISPTDDSPPTKSPPLQWRIIFTALLCATRFFQPTTFILAAALFFKSIGALTGSNTVLMNTTLPFSLGTTQKRTQQRSRFMNGLIMYLQFIMANKDSRYLFFFLLANLAFMVVELVYGLISNSLGLISDSAHMFFDCGALAIGLYGSFMSKWKSNNVYTYGYGRFEYISALINGLLLVFISVYIALEAFHRIFDPPVIESAGRLILISVMGFFVNLTGMFFFHQDEQDEHHNENMYGVYLHMLADTLGSVSVIISTVIMQYFGWYMADPICSLLISLMILGASYPLLSNSMAVLLQRSPRLSDAKITSCLETIEHWSGILSVTNTHFWTMDNNTVVGTLHVKVEDHINEQQMRQKISEALLQCGINSVTIQLDKSEVGYVSTPPVAKASTGGP